MTNINYTAEMVALLEQNAPIDFDKAQALGKEMGRSVKSVIAKCKREGIEYISKPAPARKKSAPTKADLVGAICKGLDLDDCQGLEKPLVWHSLNYLARLNNRRLTLTKSLYNQGLINEKRVFIMVNLIGWIGAVAMVAFSFLYLFRLLYSVWLA